MVRLCLFVVLCTQCGVAAAFAQQAGYPSCAQARATILRQGAAVVRTAPNIYDRYVADESYCAHGEYGARVLAETRDTPNCFIGYVCKMGSPLDD